MVSDDTFMSIETTYDAAIIGGGLGGLTLAISLAKAGKSILLLEKESYPFHRVCGEYISMESYDFLQRLGLPLDALNLPRINRLKVSAPNGRFLTHQLDLGGFGISRYKLDELLYHLAVQAGVHVHCQTKVNDVTLQGAHFIIHTSKGLFQSKQTFGAWGKRANLDVKQKRDFIQPRKRSLSNYIGIKYHIKVDMPDDVIELHNFKDGYCGISKIEDDKYCFCYLTTADLLKQFDGNIKAMEEQVLYQNPFLKHYFSNATFLFDEPLAISQISFEKKSISENGVLMLGDAAGLITPLCGNGMSMAMHSAYVLAQLVLQYEQRAELLEQAYQAEWNKLFATRLKTGRFIQSLFGHPVLTNLTIMALKPFPFVIHQLVSATHGKPF